MNQDHLLIILAAAAAAVSTRFLPSVLFSDRPVPVRLQHFLKHVPTAVFTALIAPVLVMPGGLVSLSPDNHYLIAGIASIFLAVRFRKFVITVGVGTAVMIALRLATL